MPDDDKTDSGLLTEEDTRESVDPTGWLLLRFTTVT